MNATMNEKTGLPVCDVCHTEDAPLVHTDGWVWRCEKCYQKYEQVRDAAPELLAACKAVLDFDFIKDTWTGLRNRLESAIARAEGRNP